MKKTLVFIIATVLILTCVEAFAAPPQAGKSAQTGEYPMGPIQKLERGVGNAAFGWTEIPKRIVDQTKASNPIKGIIYGSLQGVCKAFARTISGLADIVTFPLGSYDKPAIVPDMPAAQ